MIVHFDEQSHSFDRKDALSGKGSPGVVLVFVLMISKVILVRVTSTASVFANLTTQANTVVEKHGPREDPPYRKTSEWVKVLSTC